MKISILIILLLASASELNAQYPVIKGCPATVDFSKSLREWDGFGGFKGRAAWNEGGMDHVDGQ